MQNEHKELAYRSSISTVTKSDVLFSSRSKMVAQPHDILKEIILYMEETS